MALRVFHSLIAFQVDIILISEYFIFSHFIAERFGCKKCYGKGHRAKI